MGVGDGWLFFWVWVWGVENGVLGLWFMCYESRGIG